MSKAYDALMRELEAETSSPETANTETPAETAPAPAETPAEEPNPTEEPTPTEEPKPAEPNPSEEPKPTEEPPKKPSEYTQEERAQFAFQRQLAKERERHAKEIQELQKGWESKFEELKKSYPKQQEPKKTRADFGSDDEFIDYLVKERYEKERTADAEARAKEAEERARQQSEQDEQNRILQSEQAAWLSNVDNAFGEDAKGKQTFLSRLQTCLDKGLGTVLDNCPVAADYLLHNANGPKVMEKMLADRQTFERVFNDRSSPMDQYWSLRQIEAELKAQPSATPAPQTPAPAPAPMPRLGHPGKSGNGSAPDIFSDEHAMREFLRSR